MSRLTIELTEQQETFLKEFTAKHYSGSKDNVATHQPIHLVQTRMERVVDPDYDNPDEIKYIVPDWDNEGYNSPEELVKAWYENNCEDCPIDIVSFDESYRQKRFIDIFGEEQVIVNEKDYFEAYGINEDKYCKVHTAYYYETKAAFFILDEAKRYMKYQGHNLDHPRTYTIGGGYANKGDYHHFWELLFSMGQKLNDESSGV